MSTETTDTAIDPTEESDAPIGFHTAPLSPESDRKWWPLAITYGSKRRVEQETKVNLMSVLDDKGIEALIRDTDQLVTLLWSMVRPQADGAGITEEQFLDLLDAQAIEDAMLAIVRAVIRFCPSPPKRKLYRRAFDRTMEAQDRQFALMEKLLDPKLEAIEATVAAQLHKTLGTPESPALPSSESSPGSTPSAS